MLLAKKQNNFTRPALAALQGKAYFTQPGKTLRRETLAATGTTDPLLQARLAGEHRQTARIAGGLARRTFVLPWLAEPPVGVAALGALAAPAAV